MYSRGRHDGFSYAVTNIDDHQLARQLEFFSKIITGYLNNDPLPFAAGMPETLYTNRLRFKRNWTLAELVEGAQEVALECKAIYDAHHNGEPRWKNT
jgi:hypothetical protein